MSVLSLFYHYFITILCLFYPKVNGDYNILITRKNQDILSGSCGRMIFKEIVIRLSAN